MENPVFASVEAVERFMESFNKRDWVEAARQFSVTYTSHDQAVQSKTGTPEEFLRFARGWTEKMPDGMCSDVEYTPADDGIVITRFTWSGTHSGEPFLGYQANGGHASARICILFTCDSDGLICRGEAFWDLLHYMAELGHLPADVTSGGSPAVASDRK